MHKRQPGMALWPFLIVSAEAMWLFVGVYLIAVWKDEVMAFFAPLPAPSDWPAMVGAALAQDALPRPADRPIEPLGDTLLAVAALAVLPLVWFNLGAIIRGSDVETLTPALDRRVGTVTQRWRAVPGMIRDFTEYFIAGAIRRWTAVANAAASMGSLSLGLLVGVVVGYRLIDWLAAWGIWGTMQLVGPLEYEAARIAEHLARESAPLLAVTISRSEPPFTRPTSPDEACLRTLLPSAVERRPR